MWWQWLIGIAAGIYFAFALIDTVRDRLDRRTRRVIHEELIRRRLL